MKEYKMLCNKCKAELKHIIRDNEVLTSLDVLIKCENCGTKNLYNLSQLELAEKIFRQ